MISPVKIWRNQKKIAELMGKSGKIVTHTVIRVPLAGFSEQAPYVVAVIQMKNGVLLTAQLVDSDCEKIITGQKVRLVVRRIREPDPDGVIPYGFKAVVMKGN